MKLFILIATNLAAGVLSAVGSNSICEGVLQLSHDLNDNSLCFHALKTPLSRITDPTGTHFAQGSNYIISHSRPSNDAVPMLINCLHHVKKTIDDALALDTDREFEVSFPNLNSDRIQLQEIITNIERNLSAVSDVNGIYPEVEDVLRGVVFAKAALDGSLILETCLSGGSFSKRQVSNILPSVTYASKDAG